MDVIVGRIIDVALIYICREVRRICAPDQGSGSACAEVILINIGLVVVLVIPEGPFCNQIGVCQRRHSLDDARVVRWAEVRRPSIPAHWSALRPFSRYSPK